MTYSIKPLLLGKWKTSKSQMTYFVDWGKEIWSATVAWYIKAGRQNVLIDTGISHPEIQKYLYGRAYEEIKTFEQALSSADITPEDVDIVIQTHLHFDHCANTHKCLSCRDLQPAIKINKSIENIESLLTKNEQTTGGDL